MSFMGVSLPCLNVTSCPVAKCKTGMENASETIHQEEKLTMCWNDGTWLWKPAENTWITMCCTTWVGENCWPREPLPLPALYGTCSSVSIMTVLTHFIISRRWCRQRDSCKTYLCRLICQWIRSLISIIMLYDWVLMQYNRKTILSICTDRNFYILTVVNYQ